MKKTSLLFALLMSCAAVAYAATAMTIGGDVLFSPDGTYNIGANGVSRPQDIYASQDIKAARYVQAGGNITSTGGGFIATSGASSFFQLSASGDVSFSGKIDAFQGIRLATSGVQPTCNSASRGTLFSVFGDTGVKDTVQVCAKDASNSYSWRTLW